MIKKNVCKDSSTAVKMARESVERSARQYEAQLRYEKREGQKTFRFKKLMGIVYDNIKNRIIYIANDEKNNYDLDDVMVCLQDKESKIYKQICESVIKRTKMMANQYDDIALARAKKNGESIENVKLINKNKINLEATIKHLLEDKYGLIEKAIEYLRKEKEEEQHKEVEAKKNKTAGIPNTGEDR